MFVSALRLADGTVQRLIVVTTPEKAFMHHGQTHFTLEDHFDGSTARPESQSTVPLLGQDGFVLCALMPIFLPAGPKSPSAP